MSSDLYCFVPLPVLVISVRFRDLTNGRKEKLKNGIAFVKLLSFVCMIVAYTDLCPCVPMCDYDICIPGQVTVSEQSKPRSIVLYCFY